MQWIKVKYALPTKDCVCVVHNDSHPFQFYICTYSAYFKEFEVYIVGHTRFSDPISFSATHWMKLESPSQETK